MAVLHTEQRGRVLVLTIDDPTTRNALGPDIYKAGAAALRRTAEDSAIGAVVLTGAGTTFSSGGNLNRLAGLRAGAPETVCAGIDGLHGFVQAIRSCPKPVIAAVEGGAAGAGFSVMLACDLVVAARGARFVMAYVKVGLSPDGGATAFLAQTLPRQLAAELALEGGVVDAGRLHQAGIVNAVCEPGAALGTALARAATLAAGPGQAMASIKGLLNAAYADGLGTQLDRERDSFVANLFHADAGEGIAAFREKRPAVFGGVG